MPSIDDDEALIRGILAGARGYVRKDVTLDQLASAIRTGGLSNREIETLFSLANDT